MMDKSLSKILAGIVFVTAVTLTLPSFAQDNSSAVESQTGFTEGSSANSAPDELPEKEQPKSLSIASWGGAYMQAQDNAYFKPYQKNSGLKLSTQKHSGVYETIKTKLSSTNWDVVDLSYNMVDQACDSGLIEPINHGMLEAAPNGDPADQDFLKDGLHKCGVASMVWSMAIIYNKKAFKRAVPKTVSDFFNTKRFRGKRTLPKTAENVLELALLADGVTPEEVYTHLETPKGIERAFKKLNRLKKKVIWWSSPSEPFKLLASGKASFGIGYNGRAFSVIAEQKKPLGIIWQGQLYQYNLWVIPKNSENKQDARQFVSYATTPRRLAAQSSWFPYGPSRQSATQMIKPHPEAGIDLKPFIPTIPKNFKLALRKDMRWWDKHRAVLQARFDRWVRGEPEPKLQPDVAFAIDVTEKSDQPVIEETNEPDPQ